MVFIVIVETSSAEQLHTRPYANFLPFKTKVYYKYFDEFIVYFESYTVCLAFSCSTPLAASDEVEKPSNGVRKPAELMLQFCFA